MSSVERPAAFAPDEALADLAAAVLAECPYCAAGVPRVAVAEGARDYYGQPDGVHEPEDVRATAAYVTSDGGEPEPYAMDCPLSDEVYALATAVRDAA